MSSERTQLNSLLSAVATGREFLSLYFAQRRETIKSYSLERYARHLGFKSRGHLHEVLNGRKELTSSRAQGIAVNLKMNEAQRETLALLCRVAELSPVEQNRLAKLRERLHRAASARSQPESLDQYPFWPRIYASLGDPDGRTLAEIAQRAELLPSRCRDALAILEVEGLVRTSGDRFVATQNHVVFNSLFRDQLRDYFVNCAKTIESKGAKPERRDPHLLLVSSFSMRQQDLGAFKEALLAAVVPIIDRFERADGDHICDFVTGMA